MKNNLVYLIVLLTIGCTKNKSFNIEGNWYYVDQLDSSYNELYFENDLFVFNLEPNGIGNIYEYRIIGDSILYGECCRNSEMHMEFLYKILSMDSVINLFSSRNDSITLYPLKQQRSIYDYLQIIDRSAYILDSTRKVNGEQVLKKLGFYKERVFNENDNQIDSVVLITPEEQPY
ncbi:MAG: hypothetical protein AAF843_07625 [Bacteroidota bacterium]